MIFDSEIQSTCHYIVTNKNSSKEAITQKSLTAVFY